MIQQPRAVFIFEHAIRGDQAQKNVFFGCCIIFEKASFLEQFLRVGFGKGEGFGVKFDLEQVDGIVASIQ